MRRRVIIILATVAMFMAILAMSKMASKPTLTLLYSGLESNAAGDIVQELQQRNVSFEVRGSSIFVDILHRDELRMTLASQGLPANGGQGYELLDSLSGFGTTSQMFDAAYWRAKEGELARTIAASPHIKMARVHIANSGSNPFQRNVTPTASVSLTPAGGPITPSQATALRFLVASAVAGLSPDAVSVINGTGGLVGAAEDNSPADNNNKAQTMRKQVIRLLEAHVGHGNAIVEVSVDTVTETESIRERVFDPETRVAISTDTRESTASDENGAGGNSVTVASNLPDGDGASGDSSSSKNNETRELINYEVSETEREILRVPGSIKRITVAVLIDGGTVIDTTGAEIFEPRSDDDLNSLRELVSAAVGFNESRGDVITIKSMALTASGPLGTEAQTSLLGRLNLNLMAMIQILVLAAVTLILGLFVIRPILARPPALPAPGRSVLATPAAEITAPASGPSPVALTGEIADDNFELPATQPVAGLSQQRPAMGVSSSETQYDSDPVSRLRTMIGDRQEETVEILRGWLEDREENV